MPMVLKRNALLVLGLCSLFCWSFFFAKHSPALRDVIPFGDDPYDAVGSFAVIVGPLIALLSLIRAFRRYRELPPGWQCAYLIRSHEAVILAVFITIASDVIAMVRHPSMWIGTASRNMLIALVVGKTMVTTAVQLIVRASREKVLQPTSRGWRMAVGTTLLALAVLWAYPEQLINGTAAHLLTVLVGALVLFLPMRPLLKALVPYRHENSMNRPLKQHRVLTRGRRWIVVMVAGALIGGCAFLSEMAEGGATPPIGRLAFVASVFIGLGLAGLLIAYAVLREPLGLESQ